jgi:hypothetical protein
MGGSVSCCPSGSGDSVPGGRCIPVHPHVPVNREKRGCSMKDVATPSCIGAAMSSSPWERLWNGDEDVAAPFRVGEGQWAWSGAATGGRD